MVLGGTRFALGEKGRRDGCWLAGEKVFSPLMGRAILAGAPVETTLRWPRTSADGDKAGYQPYDIKRLAAR